ncbi:hypothetical protein PIB30_015574 [Stylosanthes scabra]|uniref:Uncharacterized protein n=1 Tax=Stylosanthes scabra TaxID=79078 RepID=A0ABU6Q827_9FABA|nr:hypothetical protein [Stylosanthes scabra]
MKEPINEKSIRKVEVTPSSEQHDLLNRSVVAERVKPIKFGSVVQGFKDLAKEFGRLECKDFGPLRCIISFESMELRDKALQIRFMPDFSTRLHRIGVSLGERQGGYGLSCSVCGLPRTMEVEEIPAETNKQEDSMSTRCIIDDRCLEEIIKETQLKLRDEPFEGVTHDTDSTSDKSLPPGFEDFKQRKI